MCVICVYAFHLRKSGENSMCPGFNLLRVPPRVGAKRHVCITNRVLSAVLISRMSETFDLLRLILRMMRTEDRYLL